MWFYPAIALVTAVVTALWGRALQGSADTPTDGSASEALADARRQQQ